MSWARSAYESMRFSKKLRQLLKKRGVSQKWLADQIGVHQTQVSRWATDKSLPDIAQGKRIALIFEVDLEYLADEEKDVPGPAFSEELRRVWELASLMGPREALRRLAKVENDPCASAPSSISASTPIDRPDSHQPNRSGGPGIPLAKSGMDFQNPDEAAGKVDRRTKR